MIRNFKKFINQKLTLIVFISFLLILIFMANGYSLLKTNLNLNGNVTANLDFYEIIVDNDSNQTYYKWKLKIEDTGYIDFPFGIDATKENNIWTLDYSSWDNRIDPRKKAYFEYYISSKRLK